MGGIWDEIAVKWGLWCVKFRDVDFYIKHIIWCHNLKDKPTKGYHLYRLGYDVQRYNIQCILYRMY